MSNYPDDIRSYDHDIRSPFNPDCEPVREDEKCYQCRKYLDECECDEPDNDNPASIASWNGLYATKQSGRDSG